MRFLFLLTMFICSSTFCHYGYTQTGDTTGFKRVHFYNSADGAYFVVGTGENHDYKFIALQRYENDLLVSFDTVVRVNWIEDISFVNAIVSNGKINIIYKSQERAKTAVYSCDFDRNCKKIKEKELIFEVDKQDYKGNLLPIKDELIQSTNHEFSGIVLYGLNGLATKQRCSYVIFNEDFTITDKGEYITSRLEYTFVYNSPYVTNEGVFCIIKSTTETKDVVYKGIKEVQLLTFNKGIATEMKIVPSKETEITNLTIIGEENGKLKCAGLFGYVREFNHGVLTLDVQINSGKVENQIYMAFSKDKCKLDSTGFTGNVKMIGGEKGGKAPEGIAVFFGFTRLINRSFNSKGDLILVFENYQALISTEVATSSRGDLAICSISKDGVLNWMTTCKKWNYSTFLSDRDHGYLKTKVFEKDDDQLYMVFNDNVKNYNENGIYDPPNHDYVKLDYEVENYRLAMVRLNKVTGEYTRTNLMSDQTNKASTAADIMEILLKQKTNELLVPFRDNEKCLLKTIKY